jgi:hypothetical protein
LYRFERLRIVFFDRRFFFTFITDPAMVRVGAGGTAMEGDGTGVRLDGGQRKIAFAEPFWCVHAASEIFLEVYHYEGVCSPSLPFVQKRSRTG